MTNKRPLRQWTVTARGAALSETEQNEQSKRNVQAFYDRMFNQCRPAEAIELYAGGTYTQHNPHVADGKAASIDYFEGWRPSIRASALSSSGLSLTGTT